MRSLLVCPILLAAATTDAAPPEMALGTQQLELAPTANLFTDEEDDPNLAAYRFAGFAQLTGGGRGGGDVGAGAAAAVMGLGCNVVEGSAQGRFRPFAEDGEAAGEVTYSVCPIAALLTVKFDGRRGMGIEPSLDARRSLWARRYNETYDSVTVGGGPLWKDGSRIQHTILLMQIGHGATTQSDGLTERTIKQLDVDVAFYRLTQLDGFGLDAIAFSSNAIKAGSSNHGAVASAFMPVRLRYDDGEYFGAAQAGWGITGGQLTASGSTEVDGKEVSSWSETIDGEGLPEITMLVGELEAGMRRERFEVSGRVARSFYPTFDGNLARESRIAGNVTYRPGRTKRTSITLAPFATRTRTWTRDDGSSLDVGAGASLHVGRELKQQLRVDAIGQAGMSPYSRFDGDRLGAPALGGQVLVAVSGRVTELQAHLLR